MLWPVPIYNHSQEGVCEHYSLVPWGDFDRGPRLVQYHQIDVHDLFLCTCERDFLQSVDACNWSFILWAFGFRLTCPSPVHQQLRTVTNHYAQAGAKSMISSLVQNVWCFKGVITRSGSRSYWACFHFYPRDIFYLTHIHSQLQWVRVTILPKHKWKKNLGNLPCSCKSVFGEPHITMSYTETLPLCVDLISIFNRDTSKTLKHAWNTDNYWDATAELKSPANLPTTSWRQQNVRSAQQMTRWAE